MSLMTDTEREKAFRTARFHSYFVRTLRVILPVCAIGICSLYAINSKISFSFDAGKGKVSGQLQLEKDNLRMLSPKYEGFDERNGKYVVEANYAEIKNIKEPHVINLNKVKAEASGKNDQWVKLIANRGTFNTKKESLLLTNNIDISTSSKIRASLKSAKVDMKKKTIVSSQPVKVEMPNGSVYAEELKVFSTENKLQFRKNVQVHLKNNQQSKKKQNTKAHGLGQIFKSQNEPIDVASEELTINDKTKVALFRGQVSAVQSDMTLRAERLRINYKSDKKSGAALGTPSENPSQQIAKIEAENNVLITAGNGRNVSANRTVFDNIGQTVTLIDNVEVSQGQNVLKGNKLIVDLKKRHSYFPAGGRVEGKFKPEGQQKKTKIKVKKKVTPSIDPAQSLAQSFSGFSENDGQPFQIFSNTLDIYDLKKIAIFKGAVQVLRGGNEIKAGEIKLEYVGNTPISNQSQKQSQDAQIRKIIASKNVFITTPENQTVTSDHATFDIKVDLVTIAGNVVLTQGDNVLKGNKLVINLKTGKYRFETGKQRVRAVFTPGSFKKPKN